MIKLLLLALSAAKFGKIALTGGTMLLSVFVYALVYGWPYAVGVVALIFCHEMGHYIAARRRGLDVGAPTFIPFVGAWIELKAQPMNAETEAFVGIAGPILGSTAAFACYLGARETSSPLLLALSYTGFVLNLFNLVPVHPLDGGRIVGIISPKLWILGLPMLVALFVWRPNPLVAIIAILALPRAWRAWKGGAHDPAYYATPADVRLRYAGQYFGLAAFLAFMALEVHEQLAVGRHDSI